MPKQRNYRKRAASSESELSGEELEKTRQEIADVREAQKYRQRARGVDVESLAQVEAKPEEEKDEGPDNIEARIAKGGGLVKQNQPLDMGGFSSERRRVPVEDKHMKKYIEEELARRQGQATSGDAGEEDEYVETEDARRQREIQEREENMRGAMLSGIPEVDLGIDAKIKNIEETERARQEMLKKQRAQSNSPHPGASTADDITASHQFRFASTREPDRRPRGAPTRAGGPAGAGAKATDDKVVDDFKKKQRRY